ncbi:hypothetical protein [Thiomicrorhabdus indica]|uniref:hypothetical protein n=1 Tax=Thiomicrorhabdus indica TaxID=2267253 RepID=UPI002AA6B0E0|nr:hypothetical protein [Thiomicrorhabdus indica]
MDRQGIIALSEGVLTEITKAINESLYSEIGGTLSLRWSAGTLNAQAQSNSDLTAEPDHIITIGYDLLLKIYEVIDEYCLFIENKEENDLLAEIFENDPQIFELIPQGYSPDHVRNNIFLGAITWIYFHELTHLIQEHGVVRPAQKCNNIFSIITEFDIRADDVNLIGRESAIYHLTELAADHGATLMCLYEAIRQAEPAGHDLENLLQLIVAGVVCVMYQFNTKKSMSLNDEPMGTHPHPLVRLELTLPIFQERLYTPNSEERNNFVYKVNQVATSVTIYWLKHIWKYPNLLEYTPFLSGTVNRPSGSDYLQKLFDVWDEIRPVIKEIRRHGDPSGIDLLNFTEEYRGLVQQNREQR